MIEEISAVAERADERKEIKDLNTKVNAVTEKLLCEYTTENNPIMIKHKATQRTYEKTDRDLCNAGIWLEEIINEIKEESMKKDAVWNRKNEKLAEKIKAIQERMKTL